MGIVGCAAGGSRLFTVGLCGLLLASGCRSSTSTSEPTGKVEHAPENAPVTLNHGPSTLDSFGVDSGASCSDAGPPSTGLDGGASCGATLAASTFQYAICSCGSLQSTGVLTTDGYDSTKGGPTGALGANVGFNASAAWSSAPSLGGNLFSPGGISAPKGGLVRGDLHLGGSVQGGGQTFTVDGNAFVEATLPSSVKVVGTTSHVSSVASPCSCGSPLPTTSLVTAHQAPNNEDSAIGLSPSAAGGGNPSQIDLPCGDFYLTVISPSKPLTIAAHGHTELYIGGAVSTSNALTFSIDPGASLDLFVAGGFSATGALNLGSVSSPSSCRVYVAGSQFQVPSSASIACNIYAPSASIGLPSTTAYGSIFAAGVTASGSATLHYDTSIANGTCATCTVASCNDGNPCSIDTCNSNGTCSHTNVANGTSCPTGANLCDQSYTCQAGVCTGTNPVTCTAQDQCHGIGVCATATGVCSNPSLANGTSCSDGNACDLNDSCQSGVCTAASHVICTAPDSCHSPGTCNASTGVCSAPTLNAGFCSISGACVASGATNGANTCETCQPAVSTTQYAAVSNGTVCNDGNACDSNDTCQTGICTAGVTVLCGASDACHVAGVCNPTTGLCSNPTAPNGTACSDGNACDLNDSCQTGVCTAAGHVTCTASDQCHTAGACNPSTGACSNPAASNGTTCNDGNACTQTDSCQSGTCVGSNPVTCTAADGCHVVGTCSPSTGQCSNPTASDGTACTGSNLCNETYACASGVCTGSNPVVCTASEPCQVAATCNPTTGTCSTSTAPDGTACNDGNACTTNDTCTGGACGGTAVTCTASGPCTTAGTCDPTTGKCSSTQVPNGTGCTGPNACQTYSCQNGSCSGAPLACQAPDACHTASCDPTNGCVITPIAGCDATPTIGDEPFETQASILGRVQVYGGAPVTGYTLTVYDVPVEDTPRSDVSVTTGADGSFWARLTSFPTSEPPRSPPHHLLLFIDAPGYLRAKREVFAHPGMGVDLGAIDLVIRDPNTVVVDATGGSVTDSSGLITLQIPPGALSSPTPITITPVHHREELPAVLPSITLTAYGFELEPTGTQLAVPATIQVSNWQNFPTTLSIPLGSFDDVNGGWTQQAMTTWNGTSWTASVSHFSTWDANPNEWGEWIISSNSGLDPNDNHSVCGGSALSVGGGAVSQDFALPPYQHRGRDYGVSLNYNSGLAGSRTLGGGGGTATSTPSQAAPPSGVSVAIKSSSASAFCVSQDRAAAVVASSPGSCEGGTCSLSTIGYSLWQMNMNTMGTQNTAQTSPPVGSFAMELTNTVSLPLLPDGTLPSSGFVPQQKTLQVPAITSGTHSACAAGGALGSPNGGGPTAPVSADPGPIMQVVEEVLVYHRHNSPFGPGWAVSDLPRLYPEPQALHSVLVRGDGSQEDFRPRPSFTLQGPGFARNVSFAFAVDPVTGNRLMINDLGNVVTLNTDGTQTAVYSGLALTGSVQSMAVTYVGGEMRLLVAETTALIQVRPGPNIDLLYTRTGNSSGFYTPSQVAGLNDLAIYTEGYAPRSVLYRFRLSTPPGSIETISYSQATGGDIGLQPQPGETLSGYAFYGPAGLTYGLSGELYVADSPRNAVYRVGPDVNGEISSSSPITLAFGDGAARYVTEVGSPLQGSQFPINQPYQLSTSPDGTVLAGCSYGVAAYDTLSGEAHWLVLDSNAPASDLLIPIMSGQTNLAAVGPSTFLVMLNSDYTFAASPVLVDASVLTSTLDPTRTLSTTTSGATLVDTTQGTVENYDTQGRLVQRDLRTGEPIIAVNYADSTSDRVSAILDPEGGATTFSYDGSSRLQTITDPAGRVTKLGHDDLGNLRTITEPDGEVMSFVYQGHQMTSKTVRGTDTTTYVYNADGTLQSATKPAGEVTTMNAALDQPTQYVGGAPSHSGSYTDAHGVTHNYVLDNVGQIATDSYTADGISYTNSLSYYGNLETTGSDPYPRANTLLRVSNQYLNSVAMVPSESYDSLGRLVDVAESPGLHSGQSIAYYSYDPNGFISDISLQPLSNYDQAITRDAVGHVLQILDHGNGGDPNRHEVDFTWRSDGQPATVTRDGLVYTLSYDASTHELNGISDALGRTTSFSIDSAGRVAVATVGNPSGGAVDGSTSTSFAYDDNNRLLVVGDALGNQTTFGYTQVSCGCSESDEVSSIRTPDLAAGQQWSLAYAPEGRLSTITDPDGLSESYTYAPTGELNTILDRNANLTALTHDHLGRVLTIVDALGRMHARVYPVPRSSAWNGPSVLNGSASATSASTDFSAALNPGDYQIGHAQYPSYGYPPGESFYRDATFDLPYVLSWDLGGRLSGFNADAGQPSSAPSSFQGNGVFYGYDTYTSQPTAFINGNSQYSGFGDNNDYDVTGASGFGRSNCAGDPQINTGYQRDLGNRVTQASAAFGFGCSTPLSIPSQNYTYYPAGALQSYSGPDGSKTYSYDARGLLHSIAVTLPDGGTENWTFTYDTDGRSFDVTYPDGHVREQLYDSEGRVTSRCYKYGSQSYCYTASYDAVGNPVSTDDPYGGSETYTYDALNRLTQVTRSVGGSVEHTESYAYNLLGALHTGYDAVNGAFTYDDQRPRLSGNGTADAAIANTLGGQPVTRNTFGQVTGLNGATLTFDAAEALSGVQQTVGSNIISETYRYDSFLRRSYRLHTETSPSTGVTELYIYDRPGTSIVGSTDPSGTARYANDPGNIVAILNASAQLQDAYIFAGVDDPLRLRRNGASYFYEIDLAGNARRLRDGQGNDQGGYRYTAFGQMFSADATTPAPAISQPLQWKGRAFINVAGGLYDMRARFWSPQLGAFLTIDGYEYHDPHSTLWGWPGQNPLLWSDPTGHDPIGTAIGVAIGTGIGGAVGFLAGAGGGLVASAPTGGFAAPATVPGGAYLGAAAGAGIGAYVGGVLGDAIGNLVNSLEPPAVFAQAPDNARDPNGPKAPGKPDETDGFQDPKGGENWVPNPNGAGNGWQDADGNVWVPTGVGPRAHGGPHWDVQDPTTGRHRNVFPPKKRCP